MRGLAALSIASPLDSVCLASPFYGLKPSDPLPPPPPLSPSCALPDPTPLHILLAGVAITKASQTLGLLLEMNSATFILFGPHSAPPKVCCSVMIMLTACSSSEAKLDLFFFHVSCNIEALFCSAPDQQ